MWRLNRSVLFAICVYSTFQFNLACEDLTYESRENEKNCSCNCFSKCNIILDKLMHLESVVNYGDQLRVLADSNRKLQLELEETNKKLTMQLIDRDRIIDKILKDESFWDQQELKFKTIRKKFDEIEKITLDLKEQLQNKQSEVNIKVKEKEACNAETPIDLKKTTIEETNQILQISSRNQEISQENDQIHATSCLPFVNSTDIHAIKLPETEPFWVACNSSVSGSGWTVILRRIDGSVGFNRTWEEYKQGFGDLRGNLFLGLEKIHLLTKSQPHELYIELQDYNRTTTHALYDDFLIGSDNESYSLKTIGKYSGTAGNTLRYHEKKKFSTYDRSQNNCAEYYGAGWWFDSCFQSLLTGKFVASRKGLQWNFAGPLAFSQMMIRPREH